MSFIYPRTISIYRDGTPPAGQAGFGAQPYPEPQTTGGVNIWSSAPIFTSIPCSIQFERAGQAPSENLPGSAGNVPKWKIFIPKSAIGLGSVKFRDFVQDDTSNHYMVYAPYWDSLGYQLLVISLEV